MLGSRNLPGRELHQSETGKAAEGQNIGLHQHPSPHHCTQMEGLLGVSEEGGVSIRGHQAFISPESGRWVGRTSGSLWFPHRGALPGRRALPAWKLRGADHLPSPGSQGHSQQVSDWAADLSGGRELDRMTHQVPHNSYNPTRRAHHPHASWLPRPTLAHGESRGPLLGLGKGQSEVRVQKRASHRALLEPLNLLQGSCFPGRRRERGWLQRSENCFSVLRGFGKIAVGCVPPLS